MCLFYRRESSLSSPLFLPKAEYASSFTRENSGLIPAQRGHQRKLQTSLSASPCIYLPKVCCPWKLKTVFFVPSFLYEHTALCWRCQISPRFSHPSVFFIPEFLACRYEIDRLIHFCLFSSCLSVFCYRAPCREPRRQKEKEIFFLLPCVVLDCYGFQISRDTFRERWYIYVLNITVYNISEIIRLCNSLKMSFKCNLNIYKQVISKMTLESSPFWGPGQVPQNVPH